MMLTAYVLWFDTYIHVLELTALAWFTQFRPASFASSYQNLGEGFVDVV
jgi:hypothetical protein